MDQGGLGLPDRDYYLSDTPKMKEVREGYRAYVTQMFGLLGDAPAVAAKKADQVMALETKLAKASLDRVSRRDPNKIYHRTDPKALVGPRPGSTGRRTSGASARPASRRSTSPTRRSRPRSVNWCADAPRADLRTYLAWRLVSAQIIALPKPFADAAFAFHSKYLTGAKEDLPRWKKCVAATDRALGEALARPVRRADLRRRRQSRWRSRW